MKPSLLLVLLAGALFAGCGQIVPLEEQACPCASGWTCCDAVCVVGSCTTGTDPQAQCSAGLSLGTQSVPGDPDASAPASVQTVKGKAQGSLVEGTPIAFSYATSIWPIPYGWEFDGWLVNAASGQSFDFQLWAQEDAGQVPLSLALYGPLVEGDGDACSGTLQGEGVMTGSTIPWTAPARGTYFAAPFHTVAQTSAGLAFEGMNDSDYAHAFIVMSSAE